MADLSSWSATPTNNDLAGYFQTGMRPSSVKTAGWDIMADLKQALFSLPQAGGTANAQTLAQTRTISAYFLGHALLGFLPFGTNTGPLTIAVDGLPATSIYAGGQPCVGGEVVLTVPAIIKWDQALNGGAGGYHLINSQKPNAAPNLFVDPCCRVAQQGAITPALTTAYQYGAVDLVQAKGAGTAVTAGNITQDAAGTVAAAATPYSTKLAGVTITGVGKVFFRRWVESRDAVVAKNKQFLVSVLCRHDVGAPINAFLTVNKFNAQDTPGAVTQLATGSGAPVAIASGVDTLVTLVVNGDTSNGFEVILEMDCGAVVTKDFWATDWQACVGATAAVCAVPAFASDLDNTVRYYERTYEYGTANAAATGNGTINWWLGGGPGIGAQVGFWRFLSYKLIAPSCSCWTETGVAGSIHDVSGAGSKAVTLTGDKSAIQVINNSGGALIAGDHFLFHFVADARL